jgi:peptidyl-prolyl cis-trans isomerase B (cyclophilin B)
MIAISLLLVGFGNYAFAQYDDKLVVLETNLGNIVIDFFPKDAPNHVKNFIELAESGFYDGVLFHRIIPGFMIQGGDPNTINGDPNTWGTGGPSTSVDAEFNTIKHNRGIVSMARSADPNSGGSQFFIVHGNSNFLDEQYTVFGRIVTEESFETLDKIAGVETVPVDRPVDPEQVKITKATVMNRSEISNIIELQEPERTQSTAVTPSTGNQKYESVEHEIGFSVPEGWLLQNPDKVEENSPDVVAVGPKIGVMNPVISLTVQETNQRTLDDLISEKDETIKLVVEAGNLKIISQEKIDLNGNNAYVTEAEGTFFTNEESFAVKFKEIMIYDTEKFYTLAYSNGLDDFNSQLPRFEETINSFEILSQDASVDESGKEGGGCLIATATFGTEFAPQVQQLREIRDNTILSTKSGIAFMSGFNQFYYSFSPVIADLERENLIFKEIVKISITPMLSTLSILNFVDINSEEEILSYGIGIVLMNIGMYFVAPAMIIYKIRK